MGTQLLYEDGVGSEFSSMLFICMLMHLLIFFSSYLTEFPSHVHVE